MSKASPRAFSLLMSIITISDAMPITVSVYAIVEPTLPVPIIEILFILISVPPPCTGTNCNEWSLIRRAKKRQEIIRRRINSAGDRHENTFHVSLSFSNYYHQKMPNPIKARHLKFNDINFSHMCKYAVRAKLTYSTFMRFDYTTLLKKSQYAF